MGHVENIEARLHAAQQTHYSERTPAQSQMVEANADLIEQEREEKIQSLTREMMRDPDDETLDFIADCNAHLYQELAALCCKAIYAPGEATRMMAISQMSAMLHPQFATAASYKLLEQT